jgi:hypothetical protein
MILLRHSWPTGTLAAMRPSLLVLLPVICVAAAPPQPPINLSIRTAGDLASLCSTPPSNAANAARLNFCNGFAQGVLQTARQNPAGPKICFPSPAPKRSETMKEFATWVKADAARNGQEVSTAFLNFMSNRFPCKEAPEKPKS